MSELDTTQTSLDLVFGGADFIRSFLVPPRLHRSVFGVPTARDPRQNVSHRQFSSDLPLGSTAALRSFP